MPYRPTLTLSIVAALSAAAGAQAPNDTPAGAALVPGPGFVSDNNGGGNSAVDGPLPSCGIPADDLWYFYVPASTGLLTVTTCPTAGGGAGNASGVPANDTVIAAFVDAGGFPGSQVACDDDACGGGFESAVVMAVTAGTGVYVSVCGWGGTGNGGAYIVEFTEGPVPPGDSCSTALPAVFGVGTVNVVPGSNPYASVGFMVPGPQAACSGIGGPDPNDVWFQFTPPVSGVAVATLCPSSGFNILAGTASATPTDAYLAAWTGACGALTAVACDNDSADCGGAEPEMQFAVNAGTTYFVQIGTEFSGAPSSGTLVLLVFTTPNPGPACPPPPNDAFGAYPPTQTTVLGGGLGGTSTATFTTNNNWATTNPPFTPTNPCPPSTKEVWHCVPYSGCGQIKITVKGPTPPPTVSLWDGSSSTGGMMLGCSTPSGLKSSSMAASVTNGPLYLAVASSTPTAAAMIVTIESKMWHIWTEPSGAGSIQLEIGGGPANSLEFSAITLDLLHPGLPANQSFPNGWFFGVPMGFPELFQELTWPGGAPFTGILDAAGYRFAFALPAGTTSGFAGIATVWSVGVAFDPSTGFTTVNGFTDPTAFPL